MEESLNSLPSTSIWHVSKDGKDVNLVRCNRKGGRALVRINSYEGYSG